MAVTIIEAPTSTRSADHLNIATLYDVGDGPSVVASVGILQMAEETFESTPVRHPEPLPAPTTLGSNFVLSYGGVEGQGLLAVRITFSDGTHATSEPVNVTVPRAQEA